MDTEERKDDIECPNSKNERKFDEVFPEVKKLLALAGPLMWEWEVTLCGQSYGAKQYHMLGIHMERAMFVNLLVSIPLACVWANAGHILIILRQDPEIAAEAGNYARFMIPSIFAFGILQCQIRFLQAQNNVLPMMLTAGVTTLMQVFGCWIFWKFAFGGVASTHF
ncbi:hypothetical protein RND71_018476 [Anisodus tanguticus]|uniref:Uncharacterized protein n=1 Tax=Anisodus tanguticus TaxID=243964 RepID=A0AAE1VK94_9SOLA|nr:hypothetical protein RND71_018476 [Anisodus tanguticus]